MIIGSEILRLVTGPVKVTFKSRGMISARKQCMAIQERRMSKAWILIILDYNHAELSGKRNATHNKEMANKADKMNGNGL